ncbi:antirestriction protein [Enterobacter sp. CC120223-11]|uniref:antirestriction protein n=1 Tax=Enterobacter sp. CC120223-11 TaxID=1378073 RepID=UPI000BC77DEC|nr:antirestriction protein [Enterobacter sp. CC120223-11]SNY61254.1 Antirestriction protein [Enterobacter sp. CC120223-11]
MTDNTLPLFTPAADVQIADPNRIIATRVADEDRLVFWPQHFEDVQQWITLEPHIFARMDRWCEDYHGGIWDFYSLSNGGAFIAPEDEDGELCWSLFNDMNGNSAELSSEAAGIAVCLMAYSHHACRTECDAMTEHYYHLRDYALEHAECNGIMQLID